MQVQFIVTKTEKGYPNAETEVLYVTLREVDHSINYGLIANEVFKDYTSLVSLEPNHTYTVEVNHPQVVLRCET